MLKFSILRLWLLFKLSLRGISKLWLKLKAFQEFRINQSFWPWFAKRIVCWFEEIQSCLCCRFGEPSSLLNCLSSEQNRACNLIWLVPWRNAHATAIWELTFFPWAARSCKKSKRIKASSSLDLFVLEAFWTLQAAWQEGIRNDSWFGVMEYGEFEVNLRWRIHAAWIPLGLLFCVDGTAQCQTQFQLPVAQSFGCFIDPTTRRRHLMPWPSWELFCNHVDRGGAFEAWNGLRENVRISSYRFLIIILRVCR